MDHSKKIVILNRNLSNKSNENEEDKTQELLAKRKARSLNIDRAVNPKDLPKEISESKEALIQENNKLRARNDEIIKENAILKNRLKVTLDEENKLSSEHLNKLKHKIKKLKKNIGKKNKEIDKLKTNLKSNKIPEYENEAKLYLDEAYKIRFLIDRIRSGELTDSKKFEELQKKFKSDSETINKEKSSIEMSISEVNKDINSVKEQLENLERSSELKIFNKKLIKYREIRNKEKNKLEDSCLLSQKKLLELQNFRSSEKELYLENHEKKKQIKMIIVQQEKLIKQLEEDISKNQLFFRTFDKNCSLINSSFELDIKKPPRLLIKISQILKQKGMKISVFLSLLDRNKSGCIYANDFLSEVAKHGKIVKEKYLNEILSLIESSPNFVELSKVEELYERFRYYDTYNSSSDEQEISTPDQSYKLSSSNHAVPEGLKSDIRLAGKINVIKESEIKIFLDEVKVKMIENKLSKDKLGYFLFGSDFDENKKMSIKEIEELLKVSIREFNSLSIVPKISRFFIEPESGSFPETQLVNMKNTIKYGCNKISKHLPDWIIFNENEIKDFEIKLKSKLTLKYDRIIKSLQKLNKETHVLFSDFLEVLVNLNIIFPEKLIAWVMDKENLKQKTDIFYYEQFMESYKTFEPIFAVNNNEFESKMLKNEGSSIFSLDLFIKTLSDMLISNPFLFPRGFLSFSSDDFINFVHGMGLNPKHEDLLKIIKHYSVPGNDRFHKEFDSKSFLKALSFHGFNPSESSIFTTSYSKQIVEYEVHEIPFNLNEDSYPVAFDSVSYTSQHSLQLEKASDSLEPSDSQELTKY